MKTVPLGTQRRRRESRGDIMTGSVFSRTQRVALNDDIRVSFEFFPPKNEAMAATLADTIEKLAPLSDHLHIVDAEGVDGEGPQIGDGEIDWPTTAKQLDRLSPGVPFIPEIWQGHVNNGEGFWTALDRLEAWF